MTLLLQGNKASQPKRLLHCLGRAMEYIAIAREEGGGAIYTSFIAFKISLVKHDVNAACNELSCMMSCTDFSSDFLTVTFESSHHYQFKHKA